MRAFPLCPSSEWIPLDAHSTTSLRKTAAPPLRPGWRGQCQERGALPLRVSCRGPLEWGGLGRRSSARHMSGEGRIFCERAPGQGYGPPTSSPSLCSHVHRHGQGWAWGQQTAAPSQCQRLWEGQGECDHIVIRSAIVFPGAWGRGTSYRAVGRLLPGASGDRKVRRGDLQPGPRKPSRPPEPRAVSFLLPPWSLGPRSVQGEVGCLSGLEGWDISGCPEKPLSTLGEGEVPPLTCPSCGLRHPDKASSSLSTSHRVPGPL